MIYEEQQALSGEGDQASVRVLLRRGHAPVRVEYFQKEGEDAPALGLRWSGPGLDGNLSLVRKGGTAGVAVARNTVAPDPDASDPAETDAAPGEVAERKAPEDMAQDLVAYWSFDQRSPKTESRFTKTEQGVKEKLIIKGQPLRYFRPAADPGSLTRWTRTDFDDSANWQDGKKDSKVWD